jgi:CheY-like chemotaxis protein
MSKSLSIMLVDDDKIDLFINSELIKQIPFITEVMQYSSGGDALRFLEQHNDSGWPDIILLDIHMPVMSGFDFLEQYVKLPELLRKKSGVIMLSSTLNGEDHERVRANSVTKGFLEKPLSIAGLMELIGE